MRAYNFGAGPAVLPTEVLEAVQAELLDYNGSGMSIMEQSHRGKDYDAVHQGAVSNVRELLGVPDDYAVLFLQGGASGQFAMVPMNLMGDGRVADYTHSGSWAAKAIKEAQTQGTVHLAADTSGDTPARMPDPDRLDLSENAAYVHVTSNETIEGTQWKQFPRTQAPLVADMSSDILSRRLDVGQFGLIYAGAQKNLGPSGVTLVIIRKDLADQAGDHIPRFFRYSTHIKADSLYNTPPTFGIYILNRITQWVKDLGGLEAIESRNQAKAASLYNTIDATEFYQGTADPAHRSLMNVTFRLPSEDLEAAFLTEAGNLNLKGLKGHRSVGGIRASIYNAFPPDGVDALTSFMQDFERKYG